MNLLSPYTITTDRLVEYFTVIGYGNQLIPLDPWDPLSGPPKFQPFDYATQDFEIDGLGHERRLGINDFWGGPETDSQIHSSSIVASSSVIPPTSTPQPIIQRDSMDSWPEDRVEALITERMRIQGSLLKQSLEHHFQANVVDRYPFVDTKHMPFPDGIPLFCVPEGGLRLSEVRTEPKVYYFCCTLANGDKLYGTCLSFDEEVPPSHIRALFRRMESNPKFGALWSSRDPILFEQDCEYGFSKETYDSVVGVAPETVPIPVLQRVREEIQDVFIDLPEIYTSRCLCILSHFPYLHQFRAYLTQLYRMSLEPMYLPVERYISMLINDCVLPPNGVFSLQLNMGSYKHQPEDPTTANANANSNTNTNNPYNDHQFDGNSFNSSSRRTSNSMNPHSPVKFGLTKVNDSTSNLTSSINLCSKSPAGVMRVSDELPFPASRGTTAEIMSINSEVALNKRVTSLLVPVIVNTILTEHKTWLTIAGNVRDLPLPPPSNCLIHGIASELLPFLPENYPQYYYRNRLSNKLTCPPSPMSLPGSNSAMVSASGGHPAIALPLGTTSDRSGSSFFGFGKKKSNKTSKSVMFNSSMSKSSLNLLANNNNTMTPAKPGSGFHSPGFSSTPANSNNVNVEEPYANLLQYPVPNDFTPLMFSRPPLNLPLLPNAISLFPIFKYISISNVIRVFEALVCERKVLILSEKLSLLAPVCEAFMLLLYPFRWSHIYIPLLPRALTAFLYAPMPYFIGAQSLVHASLDPELLYDVVVVWLDKDKPHEQDDQLEYDDITPLPNKERGKLVKQLHELVPHLLKHGQNDSRHQVLHTDSAVEVDEVSAMYGYNTNTNTVSTVPSFLLNDDTNVDQFDNEKIPAAPELNNLYMKYEYLVKRAFFRIFISIFRNLPDFLSNPIDTSKLNVDLPQHPNTTGTKYTRVPHNNYNSNSASSNNFLAAPTMNTPVFNYNSVDSKSLDTYRPSISVSMRSPTSTFDGTPRNSVINSLLLPKNMFAQSPSLRVGSDSDSDSDSDDHMFKPQTNDSITLSSNPLMNYEKNKVNADKSSSSLFSNFENTNSHTTSTPRSANAPDIPSRTNSYKAKTTEDYPISTRTNTNISSSDDMPFRRSMSVVGLPSETSNAKNINVIFPPEDSFTVQMVKEEFSFSTLEDRNNKRYATFKSEIKTDSNSNPNMDSNMSMSVAGQEDENYDSSDEEAAHKATRTMKARIHKERRGREVEDNASISGTGFREEAFIKSNPAMKEFAEAFFATQMWQAFIDERTYLSLAEKNAHHIVYFNESLAAKRNRDKLTFTKNKTPFLNSPIAVTTCSVLVAPPIGLDRGVRHYNQYHPNYRCHCHIHCQNHTITSGTKNNNFLQNQCPQCKSTMYLRRASGNLGDKANPLNKPLSSHGLLDDGVHVPAQVLECRSCRHIQQTPCHHPSICLQCDCTASKFDTSLTPNACPLSHIAFHSHSSFMSQTPLQHTTFPKLLPKHFPSTVGRVPRILNIDGAMVLVYAQLQVGLLLCCGDHNHTNDRSDNLDDYDIYIPLDKSALPAVKHAVSSINTNNNNMLIDWSNVKEFHLVCKWSYVQMHNQNTVVIFPPETENLRRPINRNYGVPPASMDALSAHRSSMISEGKNNNIKNAITFCSACDMENEDDKKLRNTGNSDEMSFIPDTLQADLKYGGNNPAPLNVATPSMNSQYGSAFNESYYTTPRGSFSLNSAPDSSRSLMSPVNLKSMHSSGSSDFTHSAIFNSPSPTPLNYQQRAFTFHGDNNENVYKPTPLGGIAEEINHREDEHSHYFAPPPPPPPPEEPKDDSTNINTPTVRKFYHAGANVPPPPADTPPSFPYHLLPNQTTSNNPEDTTVKVQSLTSLHNFNESSTDLDVIASSSTHSLSAPHNSNSSKVSPGKFKKSQPLPPLPAVPGNSRPFESHSHSHSHSLSSHSLSSSALSSRLGDLPPIPEPNYKKTSLAAQYVNDDDTEDDLLNINKLITPASPSDQVRVGNAESSAYDNDEDDFDEDFPGTLSEPSSAPPPTPPSSAPPTPSSSYSGSAYHRSIDIHNNSGAFGSCDSSSYDGINTADTSLNSSFLSFGLNTTNVPTSKSQPQSQPITVNKTTTKLVSEADPNLYYPDHSTEKRSSNQSNPPVQKLSSCAFIWLSSIAPKQAKPNSLSDSILNASLESPLLTALTQFVDWGKSFWKGGRVPGYEDGKYVGLERLDESTSSISVSDSESTSVPGGLTDEEVMQLYGADGRISTITEAQEEDTVSFGGYQPHTSSQSSHERKESLSSSPISPINTESTKVDDDNTEDTLQDQGKKLAFVNQLSVVLESRIANNSSLSHPIYTHSRSISSSVKNVNDEVDDRVCHSLFVDVDIDSLPPVPVPSTSDGRRHKRYESMTIKPLDLETLRQNQQAAQSGDESAYINVHDLSIDASIPPPPPPPEIEEPFTDRDNVSIEDIMLLVPYYIDILGCSLSHKSPDNIRVVNPSLTKSIDLNTRKLSHLFIPNWVNHVISKERYDTLKFLLRQSASFAITLQFPLSDTPLPKSIPAFKRGVSIHSAEHGAKSDSLPAVSFSNSNNECYNHVTNLVHDSLPNFSISHLAVCHECEHANLPTYIHSYYQHKLSNLKYNPDSFNLPSPLNISSTPSNMDGFGRIRGHSSVVGGLGGIGHIGTPVSSKKHFDFAMTPNSIIGVSGLGLAASRNSVSSPSMGSFSPPARSRTLTTVVDCNSSVAVDKFFPHLTSLQSTSMNSSLSPLDLAAHAKIPCQKCKNMFVPSLTLSLNADSITVSDLLLTESLFAIEMVRGNTDRYNLSLPCLPPALIAQELVTLNINRHVDFFLSPAFRIQHTYLFWNLIWWWCVGGLSPSEFLLKHMNKKT